MQQGEKSLIQKWEKKCKNITFTDSGKVRSFSDAYKNMNVQGKPRSKATRHSFFRIFSLSPCKATNNK